MYFSAWAYAMWVYRAGTKGQQNLTPRPGDTTGLSTVDSIANLMAAPGSTVISGDTIQVIDTDRLGAALSAIPDPPPPGHVSLRPATQAELNAMLNINSSEMDVAFTSEVCREKGPPLAALPFRRIALTTSAEISKGDLEIALADFRSFLAAQSPLVAQQLAAIAQDRR